jgi:hypothetical protein
MHYIREILLECFPGKDRFLSAEEMIKSAYKEEALSFLRNIRNETGSCSITASRSGRRCRGR